MLTLALGKDISGLPFYMDLRRAPHLMIAGTTGSGKSVLLNAVITSMLYKASPYELKFIMIDPKMLELSVYEDIPHLLHPVVTEPKRAAAALKWAVEEMEKRYRVLSEEGVRDIETHNRNVEKLQTEDKWEKLLPYIVIVLDELADLMMIAPSEIKESIRACRKRRGPRAYTSSSRRSALGRHRGRAYKGELPGEDIVPRVVEDRFEDHSRRGLGRRGYWGRATCCS